ncbi:hypothetical protein P7B02_10395 [Caulobacter segnis]|uniref:hypothetical protein n=1 Tax=Caulobacter segnis TaxID=88688 RepID=UPI00241010AF|nr:hypothetical protein [Caulobacter segnis]MDG2521952.1 hypothetical protein [Caulobacter segnis]
MSPHLATAVMAAPLLAGGGVMAWLLRRAWGDRSARRPMWIIAGWAAVAATSIVGAVVLGPVRGVFIAWTLISVSALALVARNVQIRASRQRGERSLAPEPSDRTSRAWRGWLRALLAGPIGLAAAMGVAVCFAVWAPLEDQTRIVLGGVTVPILWGGAMAWTLADDRILRATAVLVGTAVVTFAAAVLKGF